MRGGTLTLMVVAALSVTAAHATDTAFWKPYAPDAKTYVLVSFDGADPLSGAGLLDGPGRSVGGASVVPGGRFGAGLRLDGSGRAVFPTKPFDPGAMAIHPNNLNFSVEAWVKLDRLPAAGATALVVHRPDGRGTLGFSLFVDPDGALGMRIRPADRAATVVKSPAGKVRPGAWVHVAGVSCGGHLSAGRDALYVDGVEVYNGPGTGAAGTAADTGTADLCVGGGPEGNNLAGTLDEVRVHSWIAKFWPPDPMPWIARIAEKGLPPIDGVLDRGRHPRLTFSFDKDLRPVASEELFAGDPGILDRFKVEFKGEYVPGVRGRAVRGRLSVSGFPLATLKEGGLEFWMRPNGVNNVSDRNTGIFSTSAFAAYFFNNVGPMKSLAFFYHDAERRMRMHGDGLGTEIHPGRWYHLLFAWDAGRVAMYVDGKVSSSGENLMATPGNKDLLNQLAFNQYAVCFDIDEVAVYDVRLTAAEVANRYWSYTDPSRITAPVPPAPIRLDAWRMPSENAVIYRLTAMPGFEGAAKATLRLTGPKGARVLTAERPLSGELARLETPALPDGTYTLDAAVTVKGKELRSEPILFRARRMAWEGNRLGITDEVFPPFTPVAVRDRTVSVVLRDHRMNGFGLWDSVVSQGRELLAGPIRLRYETAAGVEGAWTSAEGRFMETRPHRAAYRARAAAPALTVETLSEIEMDGMMKLTMTLSPGTAPAPINRLWLEVPLKASEAALMHEDTGTMRCNYSGYIPAGNGVVWKSRRATSRPGWRNAFTGYLWLGGEERGLAWFAENDKGWITEKNLSERPLQEIVREGDRVVLRVRFVDIPATIEAPRTIVFGLQASPAKPMPGDWRTGARGGGLPVNPWGGHQCADKFPFEDRWEIVDRIVEQQTTGKDNAEWFRAYQKEHDIPPLRGTEDWLKSVGHFAGHPSYRNRPVLVYFEEMAAPTYRTEWQVYKDEWSRDLLDSRRSWPEGYDIFRQGRQAGGAYRVTFGPSYRDYGAWYANEWLKRGVGIYWDNTYLTTSTNPLTSAAYLTEDGNVQPAVTLWNQREYSKRIWNLMHHWQRQRKEKLLFLQHMTNASLLPVLAWTTTAFDNEFSARAYAGGVDYPKKHDPKEPFPPEYLRAQSTGRQTGCYPALCHGQFRCEDYEIPDELIPAGEMDTPGQPGNSIYAAKREWGMCRVHEIPPNAAYRQPCAQMERALLSFGYGTPAVKVFNYWDERPALKLDRDDIKWLLVARPADKRLLLILQSWSRRPGPISGTLDYGAIGFRPAETLADIGSGAAVPLRNGAFTAPMDGAYALRVLGAGAPALPPGVRFSDGFDEAPSGRWNYASGFLKAVEADGGRVLRMAENTASWMGPGRLEMWDGTETWGDGTLDVAFRVSGAPAARTPLFTVVTRARRPVWSKYGISHTQLADGQFMTIVANPAESRLEIERWTVGADGKRTRPAVAPLGPLDGRRHTLATAMAGSATKVLFDGTEAAAYADTPALGGAFGIRAAPGLSQALSIDLDAVVVRAP